jgi:DNA sulfur modification protein DndD
VKLISLEMHNFRQFVGRQKLEFADSDDRNVTLIYGANGGGKTTILNAFTWALYGTTSPDFEQKEMLITDSVWDDAPPGTMIETSVTLHFEHDGMQYRLRRRIKTPKDGVRQQPQSYDVTLDNLDESGAWREEKTHSDRIEQILPEGLSQFFFFNGERIERLVQRGAYQDIQKAIKTLLGLEQYELALKHLPDVARGLGNELRKLGKSQAGDIVSQQDQIRETTDELQDEQRRLRGEVGHLTDERDVVETKLRAHEPTAQLQLRRDEQTRAYRSAEERRARAAQARRIMLTKRAYRVWVAELLPQVQSAAAGLRETGQLPAPLKRQFVEELLQQGACICGTHLAEGESPHDHVKAWRDKAGIAEVEGAWQQMQGRAAEVVESAQELPSALRQANADIATATEEARQASEIISEVEGQLKKLPSEDGQDLERRRVDLTRRIEKHNYRLHDIERELKELARRGEELGKELAKVEITDKKGALVRQQMAVANQAHAAISSMYTTASEFVRDRLDVKIREVFSKISIKPFTPELNSNFELQLWRGNGDSRLPVSKSTGENQLLSLSFVGALVALCKERATGEKGAQYLGHLGGLYPIVMDAPFGNLDNTYREEIARALPGMASQVVVFTSLAQAEGVVADRLEGNIGAEYIICINTTKDDAEHHRIELGGRHFDYVVPVTDADCAKIERVR